MCVQVSFFSKAMSCVNQSPVVVIALLPYHDWHLHILTHWALLAFTDESEEQCHTHLCAQA